MKKILLLLFFVVLIFQVNVYSEEMSEQVTNGTSTNVATNAKPREKTKVEKLLDKYAPIILLNSGYSTDETQDVLSGLKESELYIRDLYYIYTQDVLNYYKLNNKYTTPLQIKIFKKSKEYKNKLKNLKKLKTKYKRKYLCVIDRPRVRNFDVEKSRFKITSRYCNTSAYDAWGGCSDYSIDDFVLWDYPVKDETSYGDNPYYYRFGVYINDKIKGFCYYGYYYFLPVKDDNLALNIENNKDKIVVIYLFKIRGTKTVKDYKFITVKNLRLIVANGDTGEVYLIRKIK